jgi:hypothetical protein
VIVPRRPFSLALLALVLAAGGGCGRSDHAPGPGDTTVSEAKALDEAADMIEATPAPKPVVSPMGPLPPSAPATDNNSLPPG